jgi:hypothetical protein
MPDYQGYKRQRQILELASKERQQPYLTGGFAEDAILYHKPSREHFDIDWFMLRHDLEIRIYFDRDVLKFSRHRIRWH